MTQFLLKIFIKDKDNINSPKVRTAYGILASVTGILCNAVLFGVKFFIGVLIHSISVMADAFNNLSDAASSVISLAGVKMAERPADKEHPFGHGRYEYIAALVVAFLVLQVGFSCLKSSVGKIIHPEKVSFNLVLIGILVLSVFVKLWLGLFNRKLGKQIHSSVMKATSADAFGDVLITSATILSLIIGRITGLNIDGFMGTAVSVIVLISGISIAKDTLEPLIGQAVDKDLYYKISQMVESYEGIVGTHDLIVHNYGPTNTMATIHAEVPNNANIEQAHETIDRIERDVIKELGIFLVIHMDPIEVNDEEVLAAKELVIKVVKEIDEKTSIHDFRMVNGELQANLIFDLVVPRTYGQKEENNLIYQIITEMAKRNPKYQCVITAEKSYVEE